MRTVSGMTKALLVGLALTASLTLGARSQESGILDMVKECDILAAHPLDLERMAEGVPDERIVPRLATRACEQAIAEEPKDVRFVFQLGRAKLAAGKKKEAAVLFEKAAQAGHAAAWAYLGDAYQFGHNGPSDFEKAYEAYGKAATGGFERAKALSELMYFDKTMYANDTIVELYLGNQAEVQSRVKLDDRKWPIRGYTFAMTQKFLGECDRPLSPASIPFLFKFRYGDGWTAETDLPTAVTTHTAAGEFDGQTFLKRHGCDSPIAKQLFGEIEKLLASQ